MSACTRRITSGASAWRSLPRRSFDRHPPQAVDLRRRGPDILTGSNQRRTIVLRSPGRLKIWSIDSVARQNEVSFKSSGEDGDASENVSSAAAAAASARPCAAEDIKLRAKSVEEKAVVSGGGDKRMEVLVAAAATVVLGVGNRVLYKLALVPLKQYPFFLAQLATFGYVVVYFSILYIRRQAGIVTDEMLSLPKAPFLAVGLLEALGAASGMAAGTMLSGASIPILSQTFLIWQLILSAIFLGRRYSVNQLFGCFMVAVGVIITVASGSSSGLSLMKAGIFWSLLMIASFLLQAADTVLKEVIFLDAAKRLKGRSVDLFVVNSFGSAFQALFICLLLPFLSRMWGIPFTQLQSYLKDGAACFLNINTLSTGCDGAPLLPLLFVIVNMGFNISLLHLLKVSSAVVSCLASTFSVPLSVYIFTLPLPYLGSGTALPPGFVAGVAVLVTGMLIYAWRPTVEPAKVQRGLLHEDMCETPLAIVATKATQLSRQSIGKESKQV